MRHATWLKIETSPALLRLFYLYRRLPNKFRAPMRILASPHWHALGALVRLASGQQVAAGPFRGMKLELSPLSKRHLLGYILGTQELELREVIERIVSRGYRTVLNVGAADGFYAVGLAMKVPGADVVAFETDGRLHGVIAHSAQINGVRARVRITGRCRVEQLRRELAEGAHPALIFMDIEGGEIDLLDPEILPHLSCADILVETHDAFVADCTETLARRFAATHDIERIQARPRAASDFPKGFLAPIPSLFPALCVDLMDERRVGVQQWLYLVAKPA